MNQNGRGNGGSGTGGSRSFSALRPAGGSRRAPGRGFAFLIALLVVLLGAEDALAQGAAGERGYGNERVTGLGYAGVLSEALIGVGAIHFFPGRAIGVFADWKMTHESLRNSAAFLPDVDINAITDPVVRSENEWLVFNGGVLLALSSEFALMGGLGLADRRHIYEFIDLAGEFSYFAQDPATSGWQRNVVFGLLFRGGDDVSFRFGLESGPRRISIGAYLTR
ncbi:MAG: hypothetical protein EA350_16430 [Gemmatimonadales bacterium]|nr:MAG: hypothetical protein EA350_16430 [Gemmatimonadales bacterium]